MFRSSISNDAKIQLHGNRLNSAIVRWNETALPSVQGSYDMENVTRKIITPEYLPAVHIRGKLTCFAWAFHVSNAQAPNAVRG